MLNPIVLMVKYQVLNFIFRILIHIPPRFVFTNLIYPLFALRYLLIIPLQTYNKFQGTFDEVP